LKGAALSLLKITPFVSAGKYVSRILPKNTPFDSGEHTRSVILLKHARFVSGYRFSDTASRLRSDTPLGVGIRIRLFSKLFSRTVRTMD
jgi:hypothetical protein